MKKLAKPAAVKKSVRSRRGFIMLVLIGMLAVMLVLCIGFLSMTRSEVDSVSSLRNRTECNNAVLSALDFTLASITKDLTNGDQFNPDQPVALVRDPSKPFYRWWFKPSVDFDTGSLGETVDTAPWYYLPASFQPDGFTRVRVRAMVADTNGNLDINNWMQTGNPSPVQMAHMLNDACDDTYFERQIATALTTYENSAPANGGSILDWTKYPTYNCPYHPGFNAGAPVKVCPFHLYPKTPARFLFGYRLATRTMALEYNGFVGPWTTLNEPYFTDLCANVGLSNTVERIFDAHYTEHVVPNAPQYYGYYLWPEGRFAYYHTCYTDPDTGRSPVNVNTGFPPGYYWKSSNATGYENYANYVHFDRVMRGVFNINALRRIVRVGKFWFDPDGKGKKEVNAADLYVQPLSTVNPIGAPVSTWTAAKLAEAKAKVEEYRWKLAFQYQEGLVRYFAAFYDKRDAWVAPGYTQKWDNYAGRYGAGTGAAQVKYYCQSFKCFSARFPFGLNDFRSHMADDLVAMTNGFLNPAYKPGGVAPPAAMPNDGFVHVDENDNFSVIPGRLDKRTATAVYDNIVPGRVTLWPGETDESIKYPIKQLYEMKLARDENTDQQYTFPKAEGPGTVPIGASTPVTSGYPRSPPNEKGRDIALAGNVLVGTPGQELGPWEARAKIPERQLIFGPDSFSTELTTTSTTFTIMVCAEIVDVSQGLATPNIISSRFQGYICEIAPDVKNETAGAANYASTGLAYFKEGLPRKRLTDPKFMDDSLKTLPFGRNDQQGNFIPGSNSSAARNWFDFRGIPEGQENTFYDSNQQTRRKVVIRRVIDFTMNLD